MDGTDRGGQTVAFELNGTPVEVAPGAGESLLSVLRERLGIRSVKDGCAPQGQCGCCTVLVDGSPRVSCVTPVARVAGRAVTTVEGLDASERDRWSEAFCATGGSQCGFCTPGIVMRAVGLARGGRTARVDVDRALAAHLCRCTGWTTVYDAIERAVSGGPAVAPRDLEAASRRAALEGGSSQQVSPDVPLGRAGFADDTAPDDALVAVPLPPGSGTEAVEVAGVAWVVAESLAAARDAAGKVQGRNAPADLPSPIPLPSLPPGGVRLATGWVEPAYLEPDASWCVPGGEPTTPLANGGAFGGKVASPAPAAARALADRLGRPVRVLLAREDVVRLGPKRPPIGASAVMAGDRVEIVGTVARGGEAFTADHVWPYAFEVGVAADSIPLAGPPVSDAIRGAGWAEQVVLVEGALDAAGADRSALVDEAGAAVLLDTCARHPDGARAGAAVSLDPASGRIEAVRVRVSAGDPLDEVVLRSYCVGAAHMALGWVLSEGIAADPETGEILDLTIRSFGVIRAKDTPRIDVEVVSPGGPPMPHASDAVFAAVAAATWNAVTRADGTRPETFPARSTRAASTLRS